MTETANSVRVLLSRLDGVMRNGESRWMAKCPAHDDRSPSLSIKDTGTRTLIHCFAGCEASDVLAAVGLTWQDIIRDEWQAAKEAAFHQKVKLPPVDPIALERRIIDLAESDLRDGKQLSIEDRTRLEIALQRVKGAA